MLIMYMCGTCISMYRNAGMVVGLLFSGCFNFSLAVYCYVYTWLLSDAWLFYLLGNVLPLPPLLTVVASIEQVLVYVAMAIPSLLYVSLSFP